MYWHNANLDVIKALLLTKLTHSVETLTFSLSLFPTPSVMVMAPDDPHTLCCSTSFQILHPTCQTWDDKENVQGWEVRSRSFSRQKPCHVAQSLSHTSLHFSVTKFPDSYKLCWASQTEKQIDVDQNQNHAGMLQSQLTLNQKHADFTSLDLYPFLGLLLLSPSSDEVLHLFSTHFLSPFHPTCSSQGKKNPKCIILTSILQQNSVVPGTLLSSPSPFCSEARQWINWRAQSLHKD